MEAADSHNEEPHAVELWRPKRPESTRTWEFKGLIEKKYGVKLDDYEALRQWSIDHLNIFWSEVWHFTGVKASQPFTKVGPSFNIVLLESDVPFLAFRYSD